MFSLSLTILLLVISVITVVGDLATFSLALGVVLAIASVYVLVRTARVVARREAKGLSTPPARRALLFISSLSDTLIMAFAMCIASIGTFYAFFLFVGSQTGFEFGNPAGTPAALAVTLLVSIAAAIGATVFVTFLAQKWANARWQRDTQEP